MKAVIFDLDGTLADTLESIAYCTNQALAQHGFQPFAKERYRYFVGDGAAELIRRSLIAAGDSELHYFSKMEETYRQIFEESCRYKVAPYEGIPQLLEALTKRGIRLAVLSNKPHARTIDVIQALFGEGVFDVIQGQTEELPKKPNPAGVYAIAEKWKLQPQDICYVGDTDTDMKTGKAAGAFTVGVLWGFRDRTELEQNHADALIAEPQELLAYL